MPIHRPKVQFVAGIDPDLDKSGLVIYDRKENAWFCKTVTQYELQEIIISEYKAEEIEIFVESGWDNNGFFHIEKFPETWKDWDEDKKLKYIAKAATRVGENFGVGKSIVHILTANGFKVQTRPPKSAKWDTHTFKRATGLEKGYNEEIRDACRTMWDFK
ncbi:MULTISPECIES: hypothetical protein [unclassified Spirosoma]|uniref:hypothetical protein n=1 Tax=unclassified Spirosoma TaxID=2621999 RepID=UPI001AC45C66|nr:MULTISPECIES: hypothetical protein [unclassified Spirosoma]MBN8826468.1 hypothetical protein [Spirosoma sp.]